jgi:hypothetical protein
MCWLKNTAKQIDLNSQYSAIKMYIVYSFYSDSALPIIGFSSDDTINLYLLLLYIAVIFSVFVGTQYEKTEISNEIVFFVFFKFVFFYVLTNIIVYIFFFFLGVFYVLKKFLVFPFRVIRAIFGF